MKSYVYCVQDLTTGFIKIGKASDVKKRLKNLQVGNGSVLRMLSYARFPSAADAYMFEKHLHAKYSNYKSPARNEWYVPEITKGVIGDLDAAKYGTDGLSRHEVGNRYLLARKMVDYLAANNGQTEVKCLNNAMYQLGASGSTLRRAKEELQRAGRIRYKSTGGGTTKKWLISLA